MDMATPTYLDDTKHWKAYSDSGEPIAPRTSHDTSSSASIDSLRKDFVDIEAQHQPALPAVHQVSVRSKLLFLAAYFLLNLALTLSNKAVLGKVRISYGGS